MLLKSNNEFYRQQATKRCCSSTCLMDSSGDGNAVSFVPTTMPQTYQPNIIQIAPYPFSNQANQTPGQLVGSNGPSANLNNPQMFPPGYAFGNNAFTMNYQVPGQQILYPGVQATNQLPVFYQPTGFLPVQNSNVVNMQPQQSLEMCENDDDEQSEVDEATRKKLREEIECLECWSCINIIFFGLLFDCVLTCKQVSE